MHVFKLLNVSIRCTTTDDATKSVPGRVYKANFTIQIY